VRHSSYLWDFEADHLLPVYGPENVTSGASSDIKHATDTATRMVKVRCLVRSPS
jgi:hypothetical protein